MIAIAARENHPREWANRAVFQHTFIDAPAQLARARELVER